MCDYVRSNEISNITERFSESAAEMEILLNGRNFYRLGVTTVEDVFHHVAECMCASMVEEKPQKIGIVDRIVAALSEWKATGLSFRALAQKHKVDRDTLRKYNKVLSEVFGKVKDARILRARVDAVRRSFKSNIGAHNR